MSAIGFVTATSSKNIKKNFTLVKLFLQFLIFVPNKGLKQIKISIQGVFKK